MNGKRDFSEKIHSRRSSGPAGPKVTLIVPAPAWHEHPEPSAEAVPVAGAPAASELAFLI